MMTEYVVTNGCESVWVKTNISGRIVDMGYDRRFIGFRLSEYMRYLNDNRLASGRWIYYPVIDSDRLYEMPTIQSITRIELSNEERTEWNQNYDRVKSLREGKVA